MTCPTCNSNLLPYQASCPHCGRFVGLPSPEAPSGLRPVHWLVLFSVSVFLLGTGWFVYFFARHWEDFARRSKSAAVVSAPRPRPAVSLAVVHGNIVQPSELHPHGTLYFVPIGRQVVSAQTLARYYTHKFNIQVHVLPAISPTPDDRDAVRNQYIAEEMILTMRHAYPAIARAPQSVMIALTDEDIYPRSLNWKFTYAFYSYYRFAIVSSRRMDPGFEHEEDHNATETLLNTKQLLTTYIARLYFRIPQSFDNTSLLHPSMEPDAGSDDLYESDLHSEQSANGLRGTGWPCIAAAYSYATGKFQHSLPAIDDCGQAPPLVSPDVELFTAQLATGQFQQRAMDFQLNSSPPIEFKRAYLSEYLNPAALGLGVTHNFNSWLYSNGEDKFTVLDIIHEDGEQEELARTSPGKGFRPDVVFENRTDAGELFGARATWDSGHFKVRYRDGSWATYLPCKDGRCFCSGYSDDRGRALRYDRDSSLALRRVSASGGAGIDFQSDEQQRITAADAGGGSHSSYEYDASGRLRRVLRGDGQITVYTYDTANRMTSVAVIRKPGDTPKTILSNEYGGDGRITRITFADGFTFRMDYGTILDNRVSRVRVTDAQNKALNLSISTDNYVVRSPTIRFPLVSSKSSATKN